MPRLKNKPIVLDEDRFVDWLLEIYYYRMMDQGMRAEKTHLKISTASETASRLFLEQLRSQLAAFELTFPLSKVPELYQRAIREISTRPTEASPGAALLNWPVKDTGRKP